MAGTCVYPRIWKRATTNLPNKQAEFVAQQQKAVAAIEHAIELTQELKRTSGFASCDVLIAGYEQVLAEQIAISPMAPRSPESLNFLIARIELFEEFFTLLAQLPVVTKALGPQAHNAGEPAEAEVAPATAPLRRPGFGSE